MAINEGNKKLDGKGQKYWGEEEAKPLFKSGRWWGNQAVECVVVCQSECECAQC